MDKWASGSVAGKGWCQVVSDGVRWCQMRAMCHACHACQIASCRVERVRLLCGEMGKELKMDCGKGK